jgi:hypothetical protein
MEREERSFQPPARRDVGELRPPQLLGLSPDERDAALFNMVMQLHTCVEEGKHESRAHRRTLMRRTASTNKAVEALNGRQDAFDERLGKLMRAMGLEEPIAGEDRPKASLEVRSKATVTWKDIGKIAAAVFAAMSGAVLLYQIAAPTLSAAGTALHHQLMTVQP